MLFVKKKRIQNNNLIKHYKHNNIFLYIIRLVERVGINVAHLSVSNLEFDINIKLVTYDACG